MLRFYICRYYFNASHSMDNLQKNAHQHTFSIALSLKQRNTHYELVPFKEIDSLASQYLAQYNRSYLNVLPQFMGIYPSLELMGEIIYQDIYYLIYEKGWTCLQLEIEDNPLHTYLVCERTLLPSEAPEAMEEGIRKIVEKKNRYLEMLLKLKEME